MEFVVLYCLCEHINKIRNSQDSILTSSCFELKFFPVRIVKLQIYIVMTEMIAFLVFDNMKNEELNSV